MSTHEYPLHPHDYDHEISAGRISGVTRYRKYGSVESVLTTTPADIWEYGKTPGAELYTFSTSNDINRISSSNSLDVDIPIKIDGLDSDWNHISQVAVLQGQTPISITPMFRINRVRNNTAIGKRIVGDCFVFVNGSVTNGIPDDSQSVRGYVSSKHQGTMQGIYSTARNTLTFIDSLTIGLVGKKAGVAEFIGSVRRPGNVFITEIFYDIFSNGSSYSPEQFDPTAPISGMCDFKGNVSVTVSGTGLSLAMVVSIEQI